MPKILPFGGQVDWPANEGTIGVVGVAPWATLDFLRLLYSQTVATKDWHFPRVIADINSKLPSRGRHLELGERDPSPYIAESINELSAKGATVVVVPCNTAHILYDRWARDAPVPVPHIIEATVKAVLSEGARRIATLASRAISTYGIYEQQILKHGMDLVPLSEPQLTLVQDIIGAVKVHGALDSRQRRHARELISALHVRGADGVVLGCTELASLQPLCKEIGVSVAESNAALAEQALKTARVRIKK